MGKVVARINVRDVRIAFLTEDSTAGATYELPIIVPGTMQVQLAPRVATAALHGDGRMRHQTNRVDGYDVTFDHNFIPSKLIARMMGHTIDSNGIRRGNASNQPAEFAMGWVVDLTGEEVELTWLPKCVAAPSNKNIQQTTDSIEYSTDSLTVTSMPLEYNGDYEYVADTSDEDSGFTKDDISAFLENVPVDAVQNNALPSDATPAAQMQKIAATTAKGAKSDTDKDQ